MIADLLDLTRVRLGGTIPLQRRTGGPSTDMRRGDARSSVRRIRSAVAAVGCEREPAGDWDADRLSQVVSNLLGNAIQHGGGTPVT